MLLVVFTFSTADLLEIAAQANETGARTNAGAEAQKVCNTPFRHRKLGCFRARDALSLLGGNGRGRSGPLVGEGERGSRYYSTRRIRYRSPEKLK